MNNGKILLSFRFASAMDHSAPQFSRYCPSIPLSSSSFSQVGTVSYQIISPYKFIFHPSFQVFFSHIWPRNHDSFSLERTFSSTRFVSIFEFPFGSSWSLEEGRKLKTRECSNDLVSPRERGGKKMKWKRRRKVESGIRNSLEIPPQL